MSTSTKFLSSDVYEITELIEDIKTRHIDGVESITLAMSIFGYFSEITSSMLQSAIVMASEYANEAIPVKAKFEKNIITHALSLGIEKLNAQPSALTAVLAFPEDVIIGNMNDDSVTLDREMKIMIGGYEYHLDYDVIITRSMIKDKSGKDIYVYTGMYDLSQPNPISTITNPYLSPIGKMTASSGPVILVTVPLHQVEFTKVYKKILTTNPLETKIITFDYTGQLAAFDVDVEENNKTYHLTPVYDGLIDYTSQYYINYQYLDINNIRLKFDSNSYNPKLNADVNINIYTTQGSNGNFTFTGEPFVYQFESARFNYNKLYAQIFVISPSANGSDRKSIKELKKLIPKEALARGSITNATDLNNYFNSINDDDTLLFFNKKLDNTLARLYYSFLLMRRDNIIVPTNTIPITFIKNDFDRQTNGNYSLYAGNLIQYDGINNGTVLVKEDDVEAQADAIEYAGKFAYMNPFLCVVNKLPLYMSYYLTVINANRFLEFEYIDSNSQLQFISTNIDWIREYFTDRYTYKMNINLTQNILNDMGLAEYDEEGTCINYKIKVRLVLYDNEGLEYRYKDAEFVSLDTSSWTATYQIKINTDDVFDGEESKIHILDMRDIDTSGEGEIAEAYVHNNMKAKLFVYVDGAKDPCNVYNIQNGIDFFYNYSHIMNSAIIIKQQSDASLTYTVSKFPVVKYNYMNSETRIKEFTSQLEIDRNYIDSCLRVLEDSFGIDFKFFNTYGPSELFTVTGSEMLDRVNISVKFKCELNSTADQYIEENIRDDIKAYIENINNGITNLHMENLVSEITTKYAEQLVYFDFIEINEYGTGYKHIYRPNDDLTDMVPEFLCINTLKDGTPDITIEFV